MIDARDGALHKGDYTILMDERWSMRDLYVFPHLYEQCYLFMHFFGRQDSGRASTVSYALKNYPFMGGHSIVNLYRYMGSAAPEGSRPIIAQIRYASPGWMDLYLNVHTAVQLAMHVSAYTIGAASTAKAVRSLQKTIYEIREEARRQKKRPLELAADYAEELNRLAEEVARSMGYEGYGALVSASRDPLVGAQILLAHERRMRQLVEYVKQGKATLPLLPTSPRFNVGDLNGRERQD